MVKWRYKPKILVLTLIVTLILLAWMPTAHAKVDAFVVLGDDGHLYEYEYTNLLQSYALHRNGKPSLLFDHYIVRIMHSYHDDINGYVDYQDVLREYAISRSKGFDLDAYASGPDAVVVDVQTVRVVTVENGKLVFTDKIIGDPVEIALIEINAATSAETMRGALERHAQALELNLDLYNQLSDYGKTLAAANILQRRGDSGFASAQDLQTAFTEEVQVLAEDPLMVVLHEANSVSTAQALRPVLENNAQLLELDLSQYNDLRDGSKTAVVQAVFARRGEGFADAQAVRDIFAEELANFLAELGEFLVQVNATQDPLELEGILLEHGRAMGLEIDAYSLLIRSRQLPLLDAIFAGVPYDTLETLVENFNQAVGTALTSYGVISFSHYDWTLQEAVNKQMQVNPQWDGTGQGWSSAPRSQVEYYVDPTNFVPEELAETVLEIVVAYTLNVREQPTTASNSLGTVKKGDYFIVEEAQKGLPGTAPGTDGYWFKITTDEFSGWVCGKYTDWVFELSPGWFDDPDCRRMLQFLVLSGPSGVTVDDLAVILKDKGILDGKEEAFYQACQEHGINEIFLTSLALHETGNGTSNLAEGILFDPEDGRPARTVYNMFGIGAKDSNPDYLGAQYAYNQGWFSPEEAIIGGAKFAGQSYINHPTYRQDTLYKMRWNPQNPATHQYATDIGWAYKQTKNYRNLYLMMNVYHLKFDIPVYKE